MGLILFWMNDEWWCVGLCKPSVPLFTLLNFNVLFVDWSDKVSILFNGSVLVFVVAMHDACVQFCKFRLPLNVWTLKSLFCVLGLFWSVVIMHVLNSANSDFLWMFKFQCLCFTWWVCFALRDDALNCENRRSWRSGAVISSCLVSLWEIGWV